MRAEITPAQRTIRMVEHMMTPWLVEENERLRSAIREALPWLEKAAPSLNTSAPWERLHKALGDQGLVK